jgi:hypothetical protein
MAILGRGDADIQAFVRFAKKAEIGDAELCEAIRAAERGLIAANLGC